MVETQVNKKVLRAENLDSKNKVTDEEVAVGELKATSMQDTASVLRSFLYQNDFED